MLNQPTLSPALQLHPFSLHLFALLHFQLFLFSLKIQLYGLAQSCKFLAVSGETRPPNDF